MRRALVVLVVVGACGRQADFSGPAPAGALECVRQHALAAGYELIEGRPEDDALRFSQRLPPPPGSDRRLEPDPDLGDAALRDAQRQPVENQLIVRRERGRISIMVLGLTDAGVRTEGGTNAEDQARTMIALCTTSPPTFPAAAPEIPPTRPD